MKKRIFGWLLTVAILLAMVPCAAISVSAAYEGSGTEKDPYIINTASEFAGLFHSDKNMHVKLGQNITLTGSIYVGSDITLDMNGKTITSSSTTSVLNIEAGHSLKIKGTGQINGTGKMYTIFAEGTLETYGNVTYQCPDDLGSVICLSRYGIARIYGGEFLGKQIAVNGAGKLYVYGGNIASEIYINSTGLGVFYDGTFTGKVYNHGSLKVYGGEFQEDVSSYSEGITLLCGGHFKKGVANDSTGGRHILGDNAVCIAHSNNAITNANEGIYTREEITVFSPDFAEQTPAIQEGQTELDAGTINALDDYPVSFKAKDVPQIFVDNGFSISERLIVKDSNNSSQGYDIKSGTKGQGVALNLGVLTGGDYVVEREVRLYKGGALQKTNQNTVKIKVNPLAEDAFGFKTMTPSVSEADKESRSTELPAIADNTESLIFGYTPYLSQELISKGCSLKETVYVNYNNQGTLVTLKSGANFNLMKYVDRAGDYQVWFSLALYKGEEYVTSLAHIYNVPVVPVESADVIKAKVTAPKAGALPDSTVTPVGEGYETTDVDWSYYDEEDKAYYIMSEGMTFEAGKTYECAVCFNTVNGYTFPEDKGYLAGFINGYPGVISPVYSTTKAYVTVQFTVPEENPFTVIFTADSKAQAGSKLVVDVEAMAEQDEEFMEAFLEDKIVFKWFYDGSRFANTTDTFEIQSGMVGHYVGVRVEYGENFVSSQEFLIEAAKEEPVKETVTLRLEGYRVGEEITAVQVTQDNEHFAVDDRYRFGYVILPEKDGFPDDDNFYKEGTFQKDTTYWLGIVLRSAEGNSLGEVSEECFNLADLAYTQMLVNMIAHDSVVVYFKLPEITASESTVLYGDADGNGKVDAADALKALQHAVKLITLEGEPYTAANVNGDDKIDATDALLMLQYTVKLIDKFPIQ